ncbi:MAG: hypothetical protein LBB88_01240, partial [Planctomycetaceae bacterium]|nr:hypothetical protein [Planctomycetaceae bacterium]
MSIKNLKFNQSIFVTIIVASIIITGCQAFKKTDDNSAPIYRGQSTNINSIFQPETVDYVNSVNSSNNPSATTILTNSAPNPTSLPAVSSTSNSMPSSIVSPTSNPMSSSIVSPMSNSMSPSVVSPMSNSASLPVVSPMSNPANVDAHSINPVNPFLSDVVQTPTQPINSSALTNSSLTNSSVEQTPIYSRDSYIPEKTTVYENQQTQTKAIDSPVSSPFLSQPNPNSNSSSNIRNENSSATIPPSNSTILPFNNPPPVFSDNNPNNIFNTPYEIPHENQSEIWGDTNTKTQSIAEAAKNENDNLEKNRLLEIARSKSQQEIDPKKKYLQPLSNRLGPFVDRENREVIDNDISIISPVTYLQENPKIYDN